MANPYAAGASAGTIILTSRATLATNNDNPGAALTDGPHRYG